MQTWVKTLGGLLIWAVHFFAAYGVASLFPGTQVARWLVLGLTLAGLGACLGLLMRVTRSLDEDDFTRWRSKLSAGGYLVGALAIAYQGLPAVLV